MLTASEVHLRCHPELTDRIRNIHILALAGIMAFLSALINQLVLFIGQQQRKQQKNRTYLCVGASTTSMVMKGFTELAFPLMIAFQKYTEGDLEAKHILIERNLRLVAHIVKKYQPPPEEMEDLLSIGTIGLMKAVVTFDPDKSARLASYAARCIENEVLMYLRGKKKSSKEVSLYEPIGTDREGNEIQLFDVIEMNEEDVYRRLERKEEVIRLYQQVESVLSQRERMVLKLRYGLYNEEEYTQREIAAMLGISRSYVSRIEKSAIEKLRNFFTS